MGTDDEVVSHGNARARQPSSSQPSSQAPFQMPFAIGQVVNDKYEVVELIGVGGLGFVVAALHVELGEKVALKFLRFQPPQRLEKNAEGNVVLPHIRFDRALDYLIGDWLK